MSAIRIKDGCAHTDELNENIIAEDDDNPYRFKVYRYHNEKLYQCDYASMTEYFRLHEIYEEVLNNAWNLGDIRQPSPPTVQYECLLDDEGYQINKMHIYYTIAERGSPHMAPYGL